MTDDLGESYISLMGWDNVKSLHRWGCGLVTVLEGGTGEKRR